MTPSDAAKRKAEELLLSMKSALTNKFTREEAFFIRDQIAAALHIKPGFIRDSEGVDREADLPITADGKRLWFRDTVFIARDLAGYEESKAYGSRPPLHDDPIIEASVVWIGLLGSRKQRVGFIEDCASFTIVVNPEAVFSTREAAQQSASERGGGG